MFYARITHTWETNRNAHNKYKLNLDIPLVNQVTYSNKSLRSFGPKIWNSLPHHVKSAENLEAFKKIINSWNSVSGNGVVYSLEKFQNNLLDVYVLISSYSLY